MHILPVQPDAPSGDGQKPQKQAEERVVLPHPLGPSRQSTSPASAEQLTPLMASFSAISAADLVHFQQHINRAPSA